MEDLREELLELITDPPCARETCEFRSWQSNHCYLSPGNAEKCKLLDQILSYLKSQGVVKLAENQELPELPDFQYDDEEYIPYLQRGAINYSKMLANFKKVEEIK